jgi:hypothetical protein
MRSSRAFEDGVVREVGHDPVQVVAIECRGDLPEHLRRAVMLRAVPPRQVPPAL